MFLCTTESAQNIAQACDVYNGMKKKFILRIHQHIPDDFHSWPQECSTYTITMQLATISNKKKKKRSEKIGPGLLKQFKGCLWLIEWLMTFTVCVSCSPLQFRRYGMHAKSSQLNDWVWWVVISQTGRIPKIFLFLYIPAALVTHLSSNYLFLKPALIKAMANKHTPLSILSITLIIWWGSKRVLIRVAFFSSRKYHYSCILSYFDYKK